jgi:hypothetical protein
MHRADEVILHVGFAKTGTSAIQAAFRLHKAALLQTGVLYPGTDDHHHHFQSMFADNPHALIQIRRMMLSDAQAEQDFIAAYRAGFEAEVRNAKPRRIVLSSEYITAMNDPELRRLGDYLRGFGERLRVLAYMRDPWSFSISMAQQEFRDGLWGGPIQLGYRGEMMPFLERMEHGLGARLELRSYKSDAIADFADWIGVPVEGFGDRANVGITFEAACVLTALNKLYPSYIGGVYQADGVRDWMIEAVSQAFPDGRPIRLSKRTADSIREQAASDLSAICDQYFKGRPVFDQYYQEAAFTDEPDLIDISRLDSKVVAEGMLRALHFLAIRGAHLHGRAGELNEQLRAIKRIAENVSPK